MMGDPFGKRRALVDAAPSPIGSALRNAHAGRTPGAAKSQGLKRPAGVLPYPFPIPLLFPYIPLLHVRKTSQLHGAACCIKHLA